MPRRFWLFAPLDEPEDETLRRALGLAGARGEEARARVLRRSLDARKGHPLGFHLEVQVYAAGEIAEAEVPALPPPTRAPRAAQVVVVGSGPAGTFAALRLSQAGCAVTIVEMGKPVQPRRHDLAKLVQRGALNPSSNYCFGEGGAGTFSDGKLYTRSKDRRAVASVLATLVAHGAAPDILVDARPHIGSNLLPRILVELRATLEARGACYLWSETVVDLLTSGSRVVGVRGASGRELGADAVVLAVGHSARPIYQMLHARSVALEARPFAIGARVEHPQPLINHLQYGAAAEHARLPAAFYHLTTSVSTSTAGDRGVWSFCMCPGGWIVDSSTEPEALCTNGMSLSRRDSPLANAALVIGVTPRDYGAESGGPLAGVELQRSVERRAFELGGGGFRAPAQRLDDFIAGRPTEVPLDSSYRPGVVGGDLRRALPPFAAEALQRALRRFDETMPGFVAAGAQLVGVETRSSAPVRILRDRTLVSPSHAGLYPAGEGAGYAGGIVSAAIDGLRVADAVIARL